MARTRRRPALEIDGTRLTLAQLRAFEAQRPRVQLAPAARKRMQSSVDAVARAVARGEVSYGINTGFGAFANRVIPARQDPQAAAQPDPQPRLRRRRAAARADRAPHAAAQGQQPRGRLLRRAPAAWPTCCSRCSTPTCCPSCPRRAPSARRATSRRSRTSALALIGEGEALARRGRCSPGADGAARRRPRAARAAGQGRPRAAERHAAEPRAGARRPVPGGTPARCIDRRGRAHGRGPRRQPRAVRRAHPATRAGCRARSTVGATAALAAHRQRDPPQPRGLRARAGSLRRALHAAGVRRGRAHARPRTRRCSAPRSTASPTIR